MAKKIGYFFYSFIPFLLVFVIEYAAMFFLMGIAAIVTFLSSQGHTSDSGAEFSSLMLQISSTGFSTYVMIIYALLGICAFGIWYYLQFRGNFLPNIKRTFHPMMLTGIVLIVPGVQYLSSYIVAILATAFPSWMETYEQLMESAGMDQSLTFGIFLYSVILAPVCEELICRGVTLSSAKRCLPFWAANIMQALLFGLLHMNMIQGTYAFCLGLILGYICEKGGSIYFSILLHVLFNFWGTVISSLLVFDEVTVGYLILMAVSFILLVIGSILFIFGFQKRDQKNKLSQIPIPQN